MVTKRLKLATALAAIVLLGNAVPARAGFFDQLGNVMGHLGEASAVHSTLVKPAQPAAKPVAAVASPPLRDTAPEVKPAVVDPVAGPLSVPPQP
jgi:hypothetical protein